MRLKNAYRNKILGARHCGHSFWRDCAGRRRLSLRSKVIFLDWLDWPKILIAISGDHETGWVYDGMIKGHIGGKLPVAVRQRKKGVFNISWKLKGVSYSDGPGSDTPSYRVMLNTRAGIMTETVVLLGMDGQPLRGQGKCKPYTGKS